ncbi:MAG: MFS transporter, partial [Solirubrobacterales bacterium]
MRKRGNDWVSIAAYALAAAANQMLWLTFAPITSESALHYGVSEDAIGWLSEIFPLLYVVLAVPAGLLLDRWLRPVLVGAAALTAAGGCLRLVHDTYAFAFAGQVLVAIAQPAILGAVTKLASERLEPESRTLGISLGSAGIFAGAVAALALGATVGARDQLRPLLVSGAVVAVVAALAIAVALRRPGTHEAGESVAIGRRELRAIYGDSVLRRLSLIAFMGFGVFVALTTWLQVLLEPAGVSSSTAGWLLVGMTVAGVIGSVLLPEPVAERQRERYFLRGAAICVALSLMALAVSGEVAVAAVAVALIGLFLLSALPVLLELTERRAGVA